MPPQYLFLPGKPWAGTPLSGSPNMKSLDAKVFPVPGSPKRARLNPVLPLVPPASLTISTSAIAYCCVKVSSGSKKSILPKFLTR